MSRPHRLFFPSLLCVLPLALSACVGTIYDRTYSNKVTHYKPPTDKKEVSAEALLSELDKNKAPSGSAPSGLPAASTDLPGLTPPVPGDAGATSPAAPAAAPAIPGLPPAQ